MAIKILHKQISELHNFGSVHMHHVIRSPDLSGIYSTAYNPDI